LRVAVPARAAVLVLTGRRRIYYGWWLLAGSVVAMALGSGVSFWAFGLYIDPLEDEFGWSRANVSLGISIALLLAGLTSPLVGRYIDRRGPRSAILGGSVLTAASYLLLSTTSSLWQWYAYMALNTICRQTMFFIPFQALISRWFDRKRGVALGILGTGFSMGGFIVVPLMRVVVDAMGWAGSFRVSALLVLAVFLPLGLLVVRNSPTELGLQVDGDPAPAEHAAPPAERVGLTAREAIRTPFFWILAFAVTLLFYGLFGWMVHAVPFYESTGIDRGTAALLVSIAAALGMLTRLGFGLVIDRIQRIERAAAVLVTLTAASMVALLVDDGPMAIGFFIAFWVVGSGGGALLEAMLISRAFGVKHFASILGAIIVVETIFEVASPTVAGAIFDATGSYDWALAMFLVSFVGAMVLFSIASRMPYPLDRLKAQQAAGV
jgi:sugar phosphate permease